MPTPPKEPITQAQAAATLAACNGTAADKIDNGIRTTMVQHGVNSGYSAAELAATGRMPASVGQCVADAYDTDKKPSAADKARGWLTGVMNAASEAANSVTAAVNDLAIKPGQGPTTVTIHNNTVKDPGQKL